MSFQIVVMRPAGNSNEPTTPVVLSASQNYVVTDANGLAGIVPTSAGFTGPLQVNVMATVGTNAMLDYPLQLLPEFESELGASGSNKPILHVPVRLRLPIGEGR